MHAGNTPAPAPSWPVTPNRDETSNQRSQNPRPAPKA